MGPVAATALVLFAIGVVSTVVFLFQSCSRQSESRKQAITMVENVQQKAVLAETIATDGKRVLQVTGGAMRDKGLAVGALDQELEGKRATLDALVERHQTDSRRRRENLQRLADDAARVGAEISALKEAAAKLASPNPPAASAPMREEVARMERIVKSLKRRVLQEEIAANSEELLVENMLSMAQRIEAARGDAAAAALKIAEGRRRNLANQEKLNQLHAALSASRGKLDAILGRLRR